MINLTSAFVFINLLRISFNTTEMDTITILNSAVHTESQAALLYAAIQPKEVLPLVLFKTPKRKHGSRESIQILQLPQDLVKTVTLYGRMVQGTTFSTTSSKNQMFFCPKQDSEENCLVPQEFGKYDQLECAKEPNPIVQKYANESSCGVDNSGTSYNIIYQICPNDKEYVTKARPVYEICYNTTLKKTLYAIHIILNPRLLVTKSLYREHTVPYPFTENDTLKPLNFEATNLASNKNLYSLIHPNKSDYRAQKLVPDTDLAFALWRKPTYQSFNLDWQHNSLIPLWDIINDYVKIKAVQMIRQNIAIHVQTLVYDIPASEDETIMSNIWVKIVTTIPPIPTKEIRGVVILMNNFIAETAEDDSPKISNETEKFIETFCTNDFSVGSLLREFEKVKGRVRCCSLTSELAEKFGSRDIDADLPVLYITGIMSDLPNIY